MDGQDILGSVVPTFISVFAAAFGMIAAGLAALCVAGYCAIAALALFTRFGKFMAWLKRLVWWQQGRVRAGYRRSLFGRFVELIVATPIMPIVTLGFVSSLSAQR